MRRAWRPRRRWAWPDAPCAAILEHAQSRRGAPAASVCPKGGARRAPLLRSAHPLVPVALRRGRHDARHHRGAGEAGRGGRHRRHRPQQRAQPARGPRRLPRVRRAAAARAGGEHRRGDPPALLLRQRRDGPALRRAAVRSAARLPLRRGHLGPPAGDGRGGPHPRRRAAPSDGCRDADAGPDGRAVPRDGRHPRARPHRRGQLLPLLRAGRLADGRGFYALRGQAPRKGGKTDGR